MTTTEDKAREIARNVMTQHDFLWREGTLDHKIDLIAKAIRAARYEALEDAARVAVGFSETTGPIAVCMTIADRIRSLKQDQASDSPATTG